MNISKEEAFKLIDEKIAQLQNVFENATYENSYDHQYELAYHSSLNLLEELFDEKETKRFIMNTNAGVIVIDGEEDYPKALNQ